MDGKIKCIKKGQDENSKPITIDSPYDLSQVGWTQDEISSLIKDTLIKRKGEWSPTCLITKDIVYSRKHINYDIKSHNQCPSSDYSDAQLLTDARHITEHTDEKPFKCSTCVYFSDDFSAITATILPGRRKATYKYKCLYDTSDDHTQAGKFSHQCPVCDFSVSLTALLTIHMSVND